MRSSSSLRVVARGFSTLKPVAARAKVLRGEGTIEVVAKALEMQRKYGRF